MERERPKSQKEPELTKEQIDQLGFKEKLGYFLGRKEYTAMALAAVIGWINLKIDKKEKTDAREDLTELQGEVAEVVEEREELTTLREELKIVKEAKTAGEVLNSELDIPDGRKFLVIGDSISHGFQLKHDKGKRPEFIGHDGYASYKTLALLKKTAENDPGKFKDKEKAIIYTGGNNVMDGNPQRIVADAIKMAEICKKMGIPEIVITTRFPIDPRMKQDILKKKGQNILSTRIGNSEQLRKSLLLAYSRGEFPPGTKMVDLTTQFQDENRTLQKQYAEGAKGHPYRGYIPALNFINSVKSGLSKEEAEKRAVESDEHPEPIS